MMMQWQMQWRTIANYESAIDEGYTDDDTYREQMNTRSIVTQVQ